MPDDYTVTFHLHNHDTGDDVDLRTLPRDDVLDWLVACAQAGDWAGVKACDAALAICDGGDRDFPPRLRLADADADMRRALGAEHLDDYDLDGLARDAIIALPALAPPGTRFGARARTYQVISRQALFDAALRHHRTGAPSD